MYSEDCVNEAELEVEIQHPRDFIFQAAKFKVAGEGIQTKLHRVPLEYWGSSEISIEKRLKECINHNQ